jgi:hypothetical protein
MAVSDLDPRDRAILTERADRLRTDQRIRVGDYVLFADGVLRRVAKLWRGIVQTCDTGVFYLDDNAVRMSGSLSPGITRDTLTPTDLTHPGDVVFHHHDQRDTGPLIHAQLPFRVYQCSEPSEDRWCRHCNRRVWGGHRHGFDDGRPPTSQQSAAGSAARAGETR